MNKLRSKYLKTLFIVAWMLLVSINFAKAQVCAGSWATDVQLTYDCVSGQYIGRFNPSAEPAGCPVNPIFSVEQSNTFNFSTPVSGFSFDFNAFSTGPGCARMEIRVNNLFYPVTLANLVDIPNGACNGLFSAMAVTAEGYITSSATSLINSNGQGRIIISGVNATAVTISTNDGAGSVITNPFDCISVVPINLKKFQGTATTDCNAILFWETEIESNVKNIEVMRSVDGIAFKKVDDIAPKGSYSKYTIKTSNKEDAYFMLKTNDVDGHSKYSKMILVKSNCNEIIYELMPNPTHNWIELTNLEKGDRILIRDMLGRTVLTFNSPQSSTKFDVHKLPPAVYNLQIIGIEAIKASIKFVKN